MLKIDYNNAGIKPVEPGEYEVIPTTFEVRQARSGNYCIVVNYRIRTDVSQPCAGQEIKFDNFTLADTSMWRINQASMAAGFPDGMEFANSKAWAQTFMGRAIRVQVGQREHDGKAYPEVKAFEPSKHPLDNKSQTDKPIDISDNGLPF